MIPPVELVDNLASHHVHSVAIKSTHGHESILTTWARSQLVMGTGAFALVSSPVNADMYLVLSFAVPRTLNPLVASLKKSIGQLPGNPPVHWIRPLTRQLQRLLG